MKEYYTITETINILERAGLKIDFEEICGYARENLIHPLIYIDSCPTYACEKTGNTANAIAFCYLSAYWDLDERIIVILDGILRYKVIQWASYFVKKSEFVKEPLIMGWNIETHILNGAPEGHRNPKPFSDNLKIEYFSFLKNQKFCIERKNIILTQSCVISLVSCLTTPIKIDHKKPPKLLSNQDREIKPKKRLHLLHEVIERAFKGELGKLNRFPSASELWKTLKQLPHLNPESINRKFNEVNLLDEALAIAEEIPETYDPDEIIQEVTDRKIFWRNRNEDGKPLTFRSFENTLSELRKKG